MANTILKWELESKNYDEFLANYTKEDIKILRIRGHCDVCVLQSGMMCIKRSVCRKPQNEIWINKNITEI